MTPDIELSEDKAALWNAVEALFENGLLIKDRLDDAVKAEISMRWKRLALATAALYGGANPRNSFDLD